MPRQSFEDTVFGGSSSGAKPQPHLESRSLGAASGRRMTAYGTVSVIVWLWISVVYFEISLSSEYGFGCNEDLAKMGWRRGHPRAHGWNCRQKRGCLKVPPPPWNGSAGTAEMAAAG
jgi:hypothetical protein